MGKKKKKKSKKKTTPPSGLKITRSWDKVVCEWTTHGYQSQTFQINVNEEKYRNGSLVWRTIGGVGGGTHVKTITTGSDRYSFGGVIPRITSGFRFRVSAKANKAQACGFSYASYLGASMGVPTYVLPELWNSTLDTYSYKWKQNESDGDRASSTKMYSTFRWETVVMPKGKEPDWNLINSQKITIVDPTTQTPSANQNSYGTTTEVEPNIIIVEKAADITANCIRYFRIYTIARNPKFNSSPRNHVRPLGAPEQVRLQNGTTEFGASDNTGTTASINLSIVDNIGVNARSNELSLNITSEIQFAITAPYVTTKQDGNYIRSSLSLPNGFNSWNTDLNGKFTGTGVPDIYAFRTADQIVDNTCLFVRVNRTYDGRTAYGPPVLIQSASSPSPLSEPTLSSVTANPNTKEVTVTVQNNAQLANGGNKSFIAVYCRTASNENPEKPIGIIPYSSGEKTATFQANWADSEASSVGIGIRAFVADYSPIERASSGVTNYTIANVQMQSSGIIWENNAVPLPPQNVQVTKHATGVALVTWDWNWNEADSAEISWSEDEITWESTDSPSSYVVTNTRLGKRYISNLSATTYYIRVRFIKTVDGVTTYGTYSDIVSISMSSAPNIPVLQLVPDDVVGLNDEVSAYWSFDSTDGTGQLSAELAEAYDNDGTWEYESDSSKWLKVSSEKATFTPKQMGWEEGSSHYICVRVTSESLKTSEGWSNPKQINVAAKPTITVTGIGGNSNPLRPETITLDDGSSYTYPLVLKTMPLTCTVTGADSGGFVTATIERSQNFSLNRPDDNLYQGYEGETIFSDTFTTSAVSIGANDLIGSLDDNANYRLILSVTDSFGQTVSADPYEFTVAWSRQAEKPTAQITLDTDLDIATIKPIAPAHATSNDRCDIYRLSADRPMLIKGNATFGETYVDEHPTLGDFGGYRIVHVTEFGDYTTADRDFAWVDYSPDEDDEFYIPDYDKFAVIIEFEDRKVEFIGNVSVSHSWAKDFQTTVYLGGSVEGDWNADVVRSGSINSTVPVEEDPDTAYDMHLLADYAGICHVRTPDGANFYADVQAKDDREEKWVSQLSKVSLSYTTVDYDADDVLTYAEWQAEQEES